MSLRDSNTVYDSAEREAAIRVIATLIDKPELLPKVQLEQSDFHDPLLGRCFDAIRQRDSRAETIDSVTLAADVGCSVETLGQLSGDGGAGVDALSSYSRIVGKGAVRRKLQSALAKCNSAIRGGEDPEKVLEGLTKWLTKRGGERGTTTVLGSVAFNNRVQQLIELKKRRDAGEDVRTGVMTGLSQIDSYTGGLPFGVVTCVGARPKIGKSSFSLQVALTCAKTDDVLYFPIEDAVQNTQDRILAQATGIPAEKLRNLKFETKDIDRLERAQSHLSPLLSRILWEEAPGWNGTDIVAYARKVIRNSKIKLLVVDYLQVIKVGPGEDEITKINNILGGLLGIAKEYGIAVLVLSQLGRKLEDRGQELFARTGEYDGYVPQVADFKWSGSIEEVCKMALLLHRPGFYDQSLPDNEMHIQVALNNFGAGGKWITHGWDGPNNRILSRAK